MILSVSPNGFEKKYFGNFISGGREKIIFKERTDNGSVEVISRDLDITLFDKYSKINIVYKIKNIAKESVSTSLLYPFVISSITKSIEDMSSDSFLNSDKDIQKIESIYSDFLIKENGNRIQYQIEKDYDYLENSLPFKIGDSRIFFDNKVWNKEVIDSFSNKYGFYKADLDFSPKELKTVQISYIAKNYYNTIVLDNYESDFDFEDPALNYETTYSGSRYNSVSDRVFSFLFYTPYDRDLNIVKTTVTLNSNLINDRYLKIQPTNFKKSGTTYTWNYKNLKPKSLHNIIVMINKNYSVETINLSNFILNLDKKTKGNSRYYEVSDEMLLTYKPDIKENISVSEIRIMPEIYSSKRSIQNANRITEVEISFFDKNNKLIKKAIKTINIREYYSLLTKKNYITIFKDDEFLCKSISIKIKKRTNENEKIVLNDIEIIR